MTMHIRSLRIESFAAIRQMEISGLEPGLNIIVGDNEAGKSTVLAALRAAFFQRHRTQGDAARNFLPYDGAGRPEVTVEFRLGETDYTLTKSFVTRPRAELVWASGSLQGDAVEDRLAELLGFTPAHRGVPKLGEHQGAFGLLWVQQGRAPEGADVGAARDMLAASLEGEMGHFLGGGQGDAILAAARALQDRFFTANMQRARAGSPLRQAEEELESLRQAQAERNETRRRYEEKLDRLGDRRQRLAAYEDADAVGKADRSLAAAQETSRHLAGRQEAQRQSERNLEQAKRERRHALELLEGRNALQHAFETAGVALATAEAERNAAREKLSDAKARLDICNDVFEAARQVEEAAEEAERESQRGEVKRRLLADLGELRSRREVAVSAMQAHSGAAPAGDVEPVEKDSLALMEKAFLHLREVEIRLVSASAHIRFEPDGAIPMLDASGRPVATDADIPVSGTAQFSIEGVGRVIVRAGGETEEFVRRAEEARRNWQRLAARFAVDSIEMARQRHSEALERASVRRQAMAEIARVAPSGLASLDMEIAALELRERTLAEVDAQGQSSPAGPPRDEAARARRAAEDALSEARGAHAALSAEVVRVEVRHEHAVAHFDDVERRHRAAVAAATRESLQDAVAATDRELLANEAVAAAARREAESVDPELARLELERAGRSREQIVRTLRDLSQEVHGLEGELRVEGASAIEEEIARLSGEIGQVEKRIARLTLEAEAARLLYATLETCRRDAREQWLGPLKEKVAPYLRLVQLGGIVEFDDATMEVRGVIRNGVEEEFRRLSQGAREQVAVVTRLAIAEILQEAGHPAFIILDDALVNTDEKRLARMHLALGRAAASMQVIVLTCRERDFIGLGALPHRI